MSKFTPGPWRVRDNQIESMAVPPDEYGNQPVVLSLYGAMGGDDISADARLIAAAPALYVALEEISERGLVEGYGSPNALRLRLVATQSIARAALALVDAENVG